MYFFIWKPCILSFSLLPVENNAISYSLVQEWLEQPKENSENPREDNYENYELWEQTTKQNEIRDIPRMIHNVEFSEAEGEGSVQ